MPRVLVLLVGAVLLQAAARPTAASGRQLQVLAEEPALGQGIARAARQYFPGPVEALAISHAGGEPPGAARDVVRLTVRRLGPDRLRLTLSQGSALQLQRTLSLRSNASAFDQAQAVAIDLPEMLARLEESARLYSYSAPVRPAARPVPSPSATPSAPPVAEQAPAPAAPAPAPPAPAERPQEPAPVAAKPAPAPPPKPQPAPPRAAQAPVRTPVAPAAIAPAPRPERLRLPRPALATLGAGSGLLAVGIGLGAAALSIQRSVETPSMMHFDKGLDQKGRQLGIAAIAFDVAGAVALLAGGAWCGAYYLKHRRAARLALVPGGAGQSQGITLHVAGEF